VAGGWEAKRELERSWDPNISFKEGQVPNDLISLTKSQFIKVQHIPVVPWV
jgi:hypothetical protein